MTYLEEQVDKERKQLQLECEKWVSEAIKGLPGNVLSMKLRDFIQLSSVDDSIIVEGSAVKKARLDHQDNEEILAENHTLTDGRRVTRSMSRNSSLYIPSTPQLHPLLPETPAVLRKAIKLAKAASSTADDDYKRPVRITRSTIRASTIAAKQDEGNVFKAPHKPAAVKPADSTVVSLELSDGKVLDVDLSQSPKTMFKGMGKEAVKEVKSKMQTYAQQLRAFFKKLNF